MDSVKYILLSVLMMVARQSLRAQTDIDNIYCMGNGRLAAYGNKADIIQLFGPPYSSPSMLKMMLADSSIEVRSSREEHTAIWTHTLLQQGVVIGTITDFVDDRLPVLVRKFTLRQPLSFSLRFTDKVNIIENKASYQAAGLTDALLARSPSGMPFYNDYPVPFEQYMQIAAQGNVHISKSSGGNYTVHGDPGEGYLYAIGGPLYPECISNAQEVFSASYDSLLHSTHRWWQDFASRRRNFDQIIPADMPMRSKLLQTIDDVSVALRTQQSAEGGVLAGHNYHLAYVRDEYGVSRCLLALGYYPEAKAILDFYWKIWQQKHVLHTAQGMGVDAFHIHENDQVELTSYLIIQAFDYVKHTHDEAFLKQIFPMLEWAWNSSRTMLAKHMLPFNGDETYIAGGILPRSCIIDGSAETTLLFITAGEELIPWIERNKLWDEAALEENRKILEDTKLHYRENFYSNGHLYCNNPSRSTGISLPAFRHGVCEGQLPGCQFFSWTQKNANNRYLCPVCFAKEAGRNLPAAVPQRLLIHSVSLVPLYIGADMFSRKEISAMTDSIVALFDKTGQLPSRPDGHVTVGYDYGLLLYSLVKTGDPASAEIYKKMLSVLDDTGTWTEYYRDGKATGTRYRPWESGIDLEAAILFAETYQKR